MYYLALVLKGIVIGFFMLIPGISGGSIAIILDVYDNIINRVNNLFIRFKDNFMFLFIISIGGCIGLFLSAFLMDFIINTIYFELIYLFLGVMLVYLYKNITIVDGYSILRKAIFILIGILVGYFITLIPVDTVAIGNNYFTFFLLGIFLAIALILPGISVSYVLLIFSLYDEVIFAIKLLDYLFLIKLGFFLIIGIFLVVRLMAYFLNSKKSITENIICGFIISSIWVILPKLSTQKEFLYALIFLLLGIIVKKSFSKK